MLLTLPPGDSMQQQHVDMCANLCIEHRLLKYHARIIQHHLTSTPLLPISYYQIFSLGFPSYFLLHVPVSLFFKCYYYLFIYFWILYLYNKNAYFINTVGDCLVLCT